MTEYELDIEAHINLSFNEAVLGSRKIIKYKRRINCDSCNGSGSEKGSSLTICSSCKGSGQVKSQKIYLFHFSNSRNQKFEMDSFFLKHARNVSVPER